MCGITGFKNYSYAHDLKESLESAVHTLNLRGPDNQATWHHHSVGLGHARLSIIDTSERANQPMSDKSGRYTLVFNGEIYNYKELAESLDTDFISTSDTEVLLYLLINEGENCLTKLNGFFAFAFYDSKEETMLLARDRMGIKPLHYYKNEEFFVFGSEMKALMSFPIPRRINHQALHWYLRLTYLPQNQSMINGVKKLRPGHLLRVGKSSIEEKAYWGLEKPDVFAENYKEAKQKTLELLEQSVARRMVADVPLGAFLSGGTDSSAVVSIASKLDSNLNTFSIGYRDHSFFDETNFAETVAKKFNTNHTTFSLTNDDLLESLPAVIDYIGEPFADSSAIPTYILSQRVSRKMKVALSGDGADELFGGYYKHLAFHKSQKRTLTNALIKSINPLLSVLPKSRSSRLGNTARRLTKYGELLRMSSTDKYWHLASFNNSPGELLQGEHHVAISDLFHSTHQKESLDINEFLDIDLQLVLPGDMLTKVDLMSMANSLEVRVPFLDKDLVTFARSLPGDYKVKRNYRKRILQDAFEYILPKELHHRSKKGFEVPMLHWLRNELSSEVDELVFNEEYLESQGIFVIPTVMSLRSKLYSQNPEDVHITIWTLYIFQRWYKSWIE